MMKIKINKSFGGYKIGDVVNVEDDGKKSPASAYWRRRLKDSVFDDCCEILKPEKKKPIEKKTKGDNQ